VAIRRQRSQSVLAAAQILARSQGAAGVANLAGDTAIPEELLDRVRSVGRCARPRRWWKPLVGTGPERDGQPAGAGRGHDGGPADPRVRPGGSELDDPLVFLGADGFHHDRERFCRSATALRLGSRLRLETVEGARLFTCAA